MRAAQESRQRLVGEKVLSLSLSLSLSPSLSRLLSLSLSLSLENHSTLHTLQSTSISHHTAYTPHSTPYTMHLAGENVTKTPPH